MSPYILENRVNFSPVLFLDLGKSPLLEKFFERVRTIFFEKAQKSGQKPGFENQKWAEKSGAFSENGTFWRFLAIFGRFAQIGCRKTTKKPTCPLLFLI